MNSVKSHDQVGNITGFTIRLQRNLSLFRNFFFVIISLKRFELSLNVWSHSKVVVKIDGPGNNSMNIFCLNPLVRLATK